MAREWLPAADACTQRHVTHETGEVSAVQGRKIPQGRGRAPCLCKPILDFHVTRLPLKGLDV